MVRSNVLADSAALLASIVESSDDAIIAKDIQGTIVAWNPAAERMFGYTAAEAIGQSIRLIIPRDRQDEETVVLDRIRRGEKIEHFETIRCRRDGTCLPISLTVSPIRDESGGVIGASKIARDISERVRAEAQASREARLKDQALEMSRRLASIVDSSDDAIVGKDLDGIITSWNRAAERMFGYSAAEAIGRSIRMIIPADRVDEETAVIDRIKHGEKVEHFETIRRHRDGTSLAISLSVSPILDEGRVVGASKIARDITEKKRLEEKAEREHRQTVFLAKTAVALSKSLDYEQTLKGIAALAVPSIADWCALDMVQDDEGEIACLAVAHADPAKVELGREVRRRYEDSTMPYSVSRVIRTGTPAMIPEITDEMIVAAARGDQERIGMVRSLGLKSYISVPLMAGGRALGALTLATAESGRHYTNDDLRFAEDLASRAALAVANARSYEQLQRAGRLKDEFLATLSHELRTPLNAIVGYARMVRGGMITGEKLAQAVETIERNSLILTQMVEDLLEVSRIVSGKMRLNVQPVDLPRVLHEALATIAPAADAKRIRIHTVIDPQVGPISGDPDRLRQIVWNLLSNAVKFTPKEGQVQLRLERVNSHVEITISDTGDGITSDFLPYLFERFRQADSGTTREHAGLGLGLAIVRNLVEMHGGTVYASSGGPGTGATFRVRLPVMIVHPDALEEKRVHPRTEPPRSMDRLPDLGGIHVLAVDDEPDSRALLVEILEAAAAQVTTAASGAAALEKVRAAKPDVLIADIGMPLMDGFELIARLRQSEEKELRDIPAAALTAYARSEDRARILQGGFEMHLAKPIDPVELVSAVQALVRRRNGANS
jgi:PAS domain S-box-containing protein